MIETLLLKRVRGFVFLNGESGETGILNIV